MVQQFVSSCQVKPTQVRYDPGPKTISENIYWRPEPVPEDKDIK